MSGCGLKQEVPLTPLHTSGVVICIIEKIVTHSSDWGAGGRTIKGDGEIPVSD